MANENGLATYVNDPQVAEQARERLTTLLARSATDMEFRQRLLTDARSAIAEFAGRDVSEIPQEIGLKFVENKADVTIVLPDAVDPAAELSDAELEAVAGGTASALAVAASALWVIAESITLVKSM